MIGKSRMLWAGLLMACAVIVLYQGVNALTWPGKSLGFVGSISFGMTSILITFFKN